MAVLKSLRKGDHESKASVGYTQRPCLKKEMKREEERKES